MGNQIELKPATSEPDFKSPVEAGEWYDTHDTSALPGDEDHIKPRSKSPLVTVAVRVPPREMDELRRRAEALGVGYTTYIRMLIARHLAKEQPLGD